MVRFFAQKCKYINKKRADYFLYWLFILVYVIQIVVIHILEFLCPYLFCICVYMQCIKSPDIRHPCTLNPIREPFAKRQCGILLSEVFQACHLVVSCRITLIIYLEHESFTMWELPELWLIIVCACFCACISVWLYLLYVWVYSALAGILCLLWSLLYVKMYMMSPSLT